MAQNEIAAAARAICEEKGISLESVIETIEAALAAAYRKDFGEKNQNIKVDFDLETSNSRIYDEKTVVEDMPEEEEEDLSEKEEVTLPTARAGKESKTKDEEIKKDEEAPEEEERRFNPRTEIEISEAKKIKKSYKLDDIIQTDLEVPADYGRMAAQTAKQVIIQRLREVERTNLFDDFKGKEKEVVTGVVQRREGRVVLVDLGKATGILTSEGQIPTERYETGQRMKFYLEEVRMGSKGPELILSRTSPEIVRMIFLTEIPEITNDLIEIKAVAREAGSRSKIAVEAKEENVDPIGSCVGQRGSRIQTIIAELSGEKVDIIEYSEDSAEFIANSLAPAKISKVDVKEEDRTAVVAVASDQLSLAIGKGGQNVRLAARLTGWKIDIKEVHPASQGEDGVKGAKSESEKSDNDENSDDKKEEVVEEKDEKKKTKKPASTDASQGGQESNSKDEEPEKEKEKVKEEKPKKVKKEKKKEEEEIKDKE